MEYWGGFRALNKYYRRGWLSKDDYGNARVQFLWETVRLLKLRILRIVPVKTKLLINCPLLVEKHHLYIADALQLVTARGLAKAAESEGLKSVSPLTVFPLAGLGLGVGSFASPTPHGPRSSPNAMGLPSE